MKHAAALLAGWSVLGATLSPLSPLSPLSAQTVPTSQPALINIVREDVKLGHGEAHAKHEAGWPAALARAKSPDFYLAVAAMTGPTETWYITSYASHSALGESMKRDEADAVLSAELGRLSRVDAEHLNSVRVVQALGRKDLSYGAFPDLALARFFEIATFRVRPGFEPGFEAAAKAYGMAATKAGPNASWRVYEVVAGMAAPTFFVFSTTKMFGEFDVAMREGAAMVSAMTPDELAAWGKFSREGLISTETQRFRVDPGQSYVDAATRARDPDFWMPKKTAGRAPGQN